MLRYWLLLILFCAHNSLALQLVPIADDQTKNITISAYELSRIFVKGDRIQNARGLEGAYILTKDSGQGQIYVKPTSSYQQKPFNLFLTTEQGHNYNLFITAQGLPGQDIELKPNTPSKEAVSWEKSSAYSQVLVKLITNMVNGDAPEGYAVLDTGKKEKSVRYDQFIVKLQKTYRGNHLYGEVLLVQNQCNYPINLSETIFYQAGTRAIALLRTNIPAEGQTMLFRVMGDE